MATIRIIVADDHQLLRDTLRARLNQEVDITVIGTAASAPAALADAAELHPDVVLLDIDMPGGDSFDAAARMLKLTRPPRIVFLSAYTDDRYIDRALAVGATGYIMKAEPMAVVTAAIRSAARGRQTFSPAVAARFAPEGPGRGTAVRRARGGLLTAREMEVLRLVADGQTDREIARVMNVTPKTVSYHCTNLMKKLATHDRVELTRFAIREGIIEP
jgi:DNA-binding NarL/FixJ family response regulator